MSSGAKETRLINGAGYVEVTAGAGAMFVMASHFRSLKQVLHKRQQAPEIPRGRKAQSQRR